MEVDLQRSKPQSGGFTHGLLAFVLTSWVVYMLNDGSFIVEKSKHTHNNPKQVTELLWKSKISKDEEKKQRYVEVSEVVPTNIPDKTNLFSFRDQQAAQPELVKGDTSPTTPKSLGSGKRIELNNLIKTNHHTSSTTESLSNEVPSQKKNISAATETHAAQRFESSLNGEGTLLKLTTAKPKILDLRNDQRGRAMSSNNEIAKSDDLKRMRVRPKLMTDLLSGSKMQNFNRAPRKGKLAIECRLHPFGVYVQKMIKSIHNQWYLLLSSSYTNLRSMPTPQTFVYRFKLNTKGQISGLKLDEHPYESVLAAELCRQAIASRAPFGDWSPEMIQDFGYSDQITIRFQYL